MQGDLLNEFAITGTSATADLALANLFWTLQCLLRITSTIHDSKVMQVEKREKTEIPGLAWRFALKRRMRLKPTGQPEAPAREDIREGRTTGCPVGFFIESVR
jgi:hypothetical protein